GRGRPWRRSARPDISNPTTGSWSGWLDDGSPAWRAGSMIGFLKTPISTLPAARVDGPQVYLRPPRARDHRAWARLRDESRAFLTPWEPVWPADALARRSFIRRLRRQIAEWRRDEGYSFLIFRRIDDVLLGGIGL